MARLLIKGDDLVVRPSWWEKIATGHRQIRVPLSAVARVDVEPSWWRPLRGEPKRTSFLPGMSHLGVWRHEDGRDFVAVHPWKPVVVVETYGQAPFARIAVSVRDAQTAKDLVPAPQTGTAAEPQPTPMAGEPAEDGLSPQRGERGHRTVPHTADVRIEAWGGSRERCLTEAALGMVECFADTSGLSGVEAHSVRRVRVAGNSDADLLAALLEEIVFRLEVHGEVPVAVETEAGAAESGGEAVEVRLAMRDLGSVPVTGAPPKAVSWNELRLAPDRSGWSGSVTVDV